MVEVTAVSCCLDFYVYWYSTYQPMMELHPVSIISSSQGVQMSQDAHSFSVSLSRAQSATQLIFIQQKLDSFFLKVPRPGGEPGIFLVFVYFLSLKQCLIPLGYCAPFIEQKLDS